MLILDLSYRLHENLLTHFLRHQGLYTDSQSISTVDSQPFVLLTDKLPLPGESEKDYPQIWLLDGTRSLPSPMPAQVRGLLLIDCDLVELETCIRQVLRQQSYVSPNLLDLLAKQPDRGLPEQTQPLTRREQEIFQLIKAGLSIREIADKLFISPHTAENHRANIQRKKSLTGRLSLVRHAASVQ